MLRTEYITRILHTALTSRNQKKKNFTEPCKFDSVSSRPRKCFTRLFDSGEFLRNIFAKPTGIDVVWSLRLHSTEQPFGTYTAMKIVVWTVNCVTLLLMAISNEKIECKHAVPKKIWAITKYDWAKTTLCRSVCCLHCVFCKTRTCPKCGKWHLKLLHLMFDSSRNISAWEGVPKMDKKSINCAMIVAARGRISTRDDGINNRVIFSVTQEGLKKKNNTLGVNRTPPPHPPPFFFWHNSSDWHDILYKERASFVLSIKRNHVVFN